MKKLLPILLLCAFNVKAHAIEDSGAKPQDQPCPNGDKECLRLRLDRPALPELSALPGAQEQPCQLTEDDYSSLRSSPSKLANLADVLSKLSKKDQDILCRTRQFYKKVAGLADEGQKEAAKNPGKKTNPKESAFAIPYEQVPPDWSLKYLTDKEYDLLDEVTTEITLRYLRTKKKLLPPAPVQA